MRSPRATPVRASVRLIELSTPNAGFRNLISFLTIVISGDRAVLAEHGCIANVDIATHSRSGLTVYLPEGEDKDGEAGVEHGMALRTLRYLKRFVRLVCSVEGKDAGESNGTTWWGISQEKDCLIACSEAQALNGIVTTTSIECAIAYACLPGKSEERRALMATLQREYSRARQEVQ